jgi:Arc-like DNA binding domain
MATVAQEASAIISAVIPLHMRTELERRAQENDRSLSSEIRRAVRAYLATENDAA